MKKRIFLIALICIIANQSYSSLTQLKEDSLPIIKKCKDLENILTYDISKSFQDSSINITFKPIWWYILKQDKPFKQMHTFLEKDVTKFVDKEKHEVIIKCKEAINQLDFAKSRIMAEQLEMPIKNKKHKQLLPQFLNLGGKINDFYLQNKSLIENKELKIKNKKNLLKATKIFKTIKTFIKKSDDIIQKIVEKK